MSYTITVSGHKMFDTQEEAQAYEEAIVGKARSFVGTLEGVTSAMMNGQHTGMSNLQPEPPAQTEET